MARAFTRASSHVLQTTGGSSPGTAAPLTTACWFNSDDSATRQVLIDLADQTSNNNCFRLELRGDVGGDPVRATIIAGGSSSNADTSVGYTANTWQHAAAVFTSATSRDVYLNAGSSGNDTANRTPSGVNKACVGGRGDFTGGSTMSGLIAEAAVWTAALDAAELAALAAGVSPVLVRPTALAAYWPIRGRYSPEINVWNAGAAYALTVSTPVYGDHPRMYKAASGEMRKFGAAASGGQPAGRRLPWLRPVEIGHQGVQVV